MNDLIGKAIEIAGGQTALAVRCGKKQGHVWGWLHSKRVTPEVALLVDDATEGEVSKSSLRPDIFANPLTTVIPADWRPPATPTAPTPSPSDAATPPAGDTLAAGGISRGVA